MTQGGGRRGEVEREWLVWELGNWYPLERQLRQSVEWL
jgi:hypothetical protein